MQLSLHSIGFNPSVSSPALHQSTCELSSLSASIPRVLSGFWWNTLLSLFLWTPNPPQTIPFQHVSSQYLEFLWCPTHINTQFSIFKKKITHHFFFYTQLQKILTKYLQNKFKNTPKISPTMIKQASPHRCWHGSPNI